MFLKGALVRAKARTSSAIRIQTQDQAKGVLCRFRDDQRGNYAIIGAIVMPIIVGCIGLGIDMGFWFKAKRDMQGAADSAAVSVAAAYAANTATNLQEQADAVASNYGFVDGTGGTTVTVNHPPLSGNYTTNANAFEVIIQQPQGRYFSSMFDSGQVLVSSRSVALAEGGLACVLALNPTANAAINSTGTPSVALNNCSMFSDSNAATSINVGGSASVSALSAGAVGGISGTISTTLGVTTGDSPVIDPYATDSFTPLTSTSGCTQSNYSAHGTVTLSPGIYCGGIKLNAGADVTLNPGLYYMDQGSLDVNAQATLTGSGVTIIFTSSTGSNYATATINGGANVDLTPPSTGPTKGIVLFGDRNMPQGTAFKLNGGASQILDGATYLPQGAVQFAGGNNGANGCAQLIGNTITFTGNSNFSVSCPNAADVSIAATNGKLLE
jgi:Flp pilus assembly protein TadG